MGIPHYNDLPSALRKGECSVVAGFRPCYFLAWFGEFSFIIVFDRLEIVSLFNLMFETVNPRNLNC